MTVPNGTDLRKGSVAEYLHENDTPDIKTIVLSFMSKVRCRNRAPFELHSGRLRVEPHLDRKLAAAEAVETKRMHIGSESRRGHLSVNKAVHL